MKHTMLGAESAVRPKITTFNFMGYDDDQHKVLYYYKPYKNQFWYKTENGQQYNFASDSSFFEKNPLVSVEKFIDKWVVTCENEITGVENLFNNPDGNTTDGVLNNVIDFTLADETTQITDGFMYYSGEGGIVINVQGTVKTVSGSPSNLTFELHRADSSNKPIKLIFEEGVEQLRGNIINGNVEASIYLPNSLNTIFCSDSSGMFNYVKYLYYNGTIAEWNAINKTGLGSPVFVQCTDGKIRP